MSWCTLNEFCMEHRNISYDGKLKLMFEKLGRSGLRELARELEKTKVVQNCKISYNKAGIAVSGDFHLKGDFVAGGSFDLFFNCDGVCRWITYRKTKHQKDYTGEENRQLPFGMEVRQVVSRILLLSNGAEPGVAN